MNRKFFMFIISIFLLDPSTIVPTYGAGTINKIDWIYFWAFFLTGRKEENSIRLWRKNNISGFSSISQRFLL